MRIIQLTMDGILKLIVFRTLVIFSFLNASIISFNLEVSAKEKQTITQDKDSIKRAYDDILPSYIKRRRPEGTRQSNRYYILPWFVSIPGVGILWGGVGGVANIIDSGTSVAGFSFENKKFRMRGWGINDIYLLGNKESFFSFTVSGGATDIKLKKIEAYEVGRDSPNLPIEVNGVRNGEGVQLQLAFFHKRLKFAREDYRSKGYAQKADIPEGGIPSTTFGYNYKLELDLTDDRLDSWIGARMILTRSNVNPGGSYMGNNDTKENYYVDKKELSLFFPMYSDPHYQHTLALNFVHTASKNINSQIPFNRRGGEGLGGPVMMRGYPYGRFVDANLFYSCIEYRFAMIYEDKQKDFLLSNDRLENFQIVPFYEIGQVAQQDNSSLYEDLKRSYGIGFRAVLSSIVLRLDLGYTKEGRDKTFIPLQPF